MAKVIVYRRPDGGVSICRPSQSRILPWQAGIFFAMKNDIPSDAEAVEVIDEVDLPADRTFREAWHWDGRVLNTDMPKARQIHMERIRVARNARLDEIDRVETIGALANEDRVALSEIARRKQALRDVPANIATDIEAIEDPSELARFQPVELKE